MDGVVAVAAICTMITLVAKALLRTSLKRRLIDTEASPEFVRAILQPERARAPINNLKWGIVLAGLGLALLIIQTIPMDFNGPVPYAVLLLSGGGALVVFHLVATRQRTERYIDDLDEDE